MRPGSLSKLLDTILLQVRLPDEILIVDGSTDDETKKIFQNGRYNTLPLKYYKVSDEERGLTKQRNFGVSHVDSIMDIVAFLDDDTELDPLYFLEIEKTFESHKDAVGVSGYITNEVQWEPVNSKNQGFSFFTIDGWSRKEDMRNRFRKALGLMPDIQPSTIGPYAHERALGGLPPSGKIYKVDYLQGAMMCFKKEIFQYISFSHYFEGYGLYEDKDFSLRAGKIGNLYVSTRAKLSHHHDPFGRPNYVKYGIMTVRNGWRVWRVAVPKPKKLDQLKWYTVTILLAWFRLGSAFKGPDRRKAFEEFLGRHIGLIKLIYSPPTID